MGCDINCHVEVKIKGNWEHYNHLYIHRNYPLFTKMANVRNYFDKEIVPIDKPRGLPENCSLITLFDFERGIEDWHSASWLSAEEAGNIQDWYEKKIEKNFMHPPLFGYLFGNNIDSYIKYPEDGHYIKELGFQDARLVFWFDN